MTDNMLYFGDNLDILRRYIQDESIDLIYLDPPFNSKATYNVLFESKDGAMSSAQINAFEDTWHWDEVAVLTYKEVVEGGGELATCLLSLRKLLGDNDMMAYLTMMAPRLHELHRVLKTTGCLYLHCDPTASHYLKMLLDAIFGFRNYRNEIVWKRTSAHSDSKLYGRSHDILFFYTKSDDFTSNKQYQPYDESYVESHYRYVDDNGRRYRTDNLTATSLSGGGYEYEWNGVTKIWRTPEARMQELHDEGRIYYTRTGTAEYIRYLDEMPGVPAQDIWDDIPPINSQAAERLGYPTQKPEALLERIIEGSSNPGDLVLDPFCGCGTTIAVAQKLERRWIGIDITHLAVTLMKHRLADTFGNEIVEEYEVIGEPVSHESAAALAKQDPHQFQVWALGLVNARPNHVKKGADKGIDGQLFFHDDPKGQTKQIIISVKAGKTGVAHIRDLRGVVEREEAEIGVMICLQKSTKPMRAEAAEAGFYTSPWGTKHPRMQILTIEDLLSKGSIDYPRTRADVTFRKAPRAKEEARTIPMPLEEEKKEKK